MSESVERVSGLTPTDVRTYGLTKKVFPTVDIFTVRYALEGLIDDLGVAALRFPRTYYGSRKPIDARVRQVIYERDGWTCQWCGAIPGDSGLQLDHIVPWSAGGSDRSDNLRTLCLDCNATRSNYRTDTATRVIGITFMCSPCWWSAAEGDDEARGDLLDCGEGQIAAFCYYCSSVSWVPAEMWVL